jgi:hypothetical protein
VARSVDVDDRVLDQLLAAAGLDSPEAAVAVAIAYFLKSKGTTTNIEGLFGKLRPEDWGDWDPAVGMNRSDPAYEETRRRKFGEDSELGGDE